MENNCKLADSIRAMWVDEYRTHCILTTGFDTDWGSKRFAKWDGGYDSKGTKHKNKWEIIAKFCKDNQLDPQILVKAMFYKQEYAPAPSSAYSNSALDRYRNYCSPENTEERNNLIRIRLDNDVQKFTSEVRIRKKYHNESEDTAWKNVLVGNNSISALFRYCVAINKDWHYIAQLYSEQALFTYRQSPDTYDKIWGEWIPQILKDRVKRDWSISGE